ncbi:phosphatase PAP2 family protein [Streptomyces sp. NPDC002779]|uniref:phosphatase PAP2 family protein n=1 Tax=Streptomyces sp. NPDC002779 TaxID=3364664 RepID=UPI0036C1045F
MPPTEPHPALTTARPADTAHPVGTATRPADTTPRPADTTPHPTPHPTLTVARVVLPPLAAAVCLSRLVVGVHYPSDVVAGAALGVLTACAGARWMKGGAHD